MGLSTYSFNDALPQQPSWKTRCARKTEHTPTRTRAQSCLSSTLEELSQSIYQGILLLGFEKKGHIYFFQAASYLYLVYIRESIFHS